MVIFYSYVSLLGPHITPCPNLCNFWGWAHQFYHSKESQLHLQVVDSIIRSDYIPRSLVNSDSPFNYDLIVYNYPLNIPIFSRYFPSDSLVLRIQFPSSWAELPSPRPKIPMQAPKAPILMNLPLKKSKGQGCCQHPKCTCGGLWRVKDVKWSMDHPLFTSNGVEQPWRPWSYLFMGKNGGFNGISHGILLAKTWFLAKW